MVRETPTTLERGVKFGLQLCMLSAISVSYSCFVFASCTRLCYAVALCRITLTFSLVNYRHILDYQDLRMAYFAGSIAHLYSHATMLKRSNTPRRTGFRAACCCFLFWSCWRCTPSTRGHASSAVDQLLIAEAVVCPWETSVAVHASADAHCTLKTTISPNAVLPTYTFRPFSDAAAAA